MTCLVFPTTVPGPVRNLVFEVVSEGAVSITWLKPTSVGTRTKIVYYEVTYGTIGGHNTTLISLKESAMLKNLG